MNFTKVCSNLNSCTSVVTICLFKIKWPLKNVCCYQSKVNFYWMRFICSMKSTFVTRLKEHSWRCAQCSGFVVYLWTCSWFGCAGVRRLKAFKQLTVIIAVQFSWKVSFNSTFFRLDLKIWQISQLLIFHLSMGCIWAKFTECLYSITSFPNCEA